MQKRRLLASIAIAGFAFAGLSACEKKNEGGPAETAGKEIDQAAATTNDKLQKAGEKISDGANKLTKKVGEKMEQAGEKIQQAADRDKDADK
ncbi:MAG TPA: hypothetical protein VL528_10935 [Oxalicibacterium sp.]|nr:hypothetical protein [Oxalicibacterium sp.]